MCNADLNGLHNPFKLITQDELYNMIDARGLLALYYPKDGGRVQVVVKDTGEELFSLIMLAAIYNPDFYKILKGAMLAADKMKSNPAKGYDMADQFIEYFRIQDFSQLKNLYNE